MAPSQSKHKLYIGNIPKDLSKEAFREQLDAVAKGARPPEWHLPTLTGPPSAKLPKRKGLVTLWRMLDTLGFHVRHLLCFAVCLARPAECRHTAAGQGWECRALCESACHGAGCCLVL